MTKLLLCFILILSVSAKTKLNDLLTVLQEGDYLQVVEKASEYPDNRKTGFLKNYLIAVSFNRLQRYDEAINYFQKALKYRTGRTNDVYYEYGQALYAANELSKARKSFAISQKKNFKPYISYYYVAHISQILEEFKVAKKYYQLVKDSTTDNTNIKQISQFQWSEVILSLSEKSDDQDEIVENEVIPGLEKALEISPVSAVASDISKRIKEIKKQFGLDPNVLKNGRVLPEKRWSGYISEDFSFDNNITTSTDLPSSQATRKGSFISKTKGQFKYVAQLFNRWVITPKASYEYKRHSDQDSDTVFTNDSWTATGTIENKFEQTMFSKKAATIFDFEYKQIGRDRNKTHGFLFYARSHVFTFGQEFHYFNLGKSTVKIKYKDYNSYTSTSNNATWSLVAQQFYPLKKYGMILFYFQGDKIKQTDHTSSTNSYMLRTDWIYTNVFPGYTLNIAYTQTIIDTKLQQTTRGYEKTYAPSIKLTKKLGNGLSYDFNYSYTRNSSKDKSSYDYKKHTTGFKIKYSF